MKLLTQEHIQKLIENGKKYFSDENFDPMPVVKLFTPDAQCTWLLTDIDPDNHDIANGLCDLGMGSPELGSVAISELIKIRGKLNLSIERDKGFVANKPISKYAELAYKAGRIVE
jgi:hypothetical protein